MTDADEQRPLKAILATSEAGLGLLRDLFLLAAVGLVAGSAPGVAATVLALVVWGAVLAKYLAMAFSGGSYVQRLAKPDSSPRRRLVVLGVATASIVFMLSTASHDLEAQLRIAIAHLSTLGHVAAP